MIPGLKTRKRVVVEDYADGVAENSKFSVPLPLNMEAYAGIEVLIEATNSHGVAPTADGDFSKLVTSMKLRLGATDIYEATSGFDLYKRNMLDYGVNAEQACPKETASVSWVKFFLPIVDIKSPNPAAFLRRTSGLSNHFLEVTLGAAALCYVDGTVSFTPITITVYAHEAEGKSAGGMVCIFTDDLITVPASGKVYSEYKEAGSILKRLGLLAYSSAAALSDSNITSIEIKDRAGKHDVMEKTKWRSIRAASGMLTGIDASLLDTGIAMLPVSGNMGEYQVVSSVSNPVEIHVEGGSADYLRVLRTLHVPLAMLPGLVAV